LRGEAVDKISRKNHPVFIHSFSTVNPGVPKDFGSVLKRYNYMFLKEKIFLSTADTVPNNK
jgi:hypothetical protein